MGYLDAGSGQIVANAAEDERANFIKRSYVHLGRCYRNIRGN